MLSCGKALKGSDPFSGIKCFGCMYCDLFAGILPSTPADASSFLKGETKRIKDRKKIMKEFSME